MYNFILTVISVIFLVSCVSKQIGASTNEAIDSGKPLILTPFLESGQAELARKLSQVHNLTNLESFSGFFTIDKKYHSNIFFWFFPAAVSFMANTMTLSFTINPCINFSCVTYYINDFRRCTHLHWLLKYLFNV